MDVRSVLGPILLLVAVAAYPGSTLLREAEAAPARCDSRPTTDAAGTTQGTACADVIVAGPEVERVFGAGGDDRIYAVAGVDVRGGRGDDRIYASPEGVTVAGGPGADVINARLPRSIRRSIAARAVTQSYPDVVQADGPVSYWRFGESSGTVAVDQQGAGDGAYQNAPGLGAGGLITGPDTAVHFNGSDEFVQVSDHAPLDFNGAFTLEAWVRLDSNATSARHFLGKLSHGTGGYWLGTSDNAQQRPVIGVHLPGAYPVFVGNTGLAAGSTYHVVGVWYGTTGALFVNGQRDSGTQFSSGAPAANGAPLTIARRGDEGAVDGIVDEVAVYGAALSDERIAAHYAAGTGAAAPTSCPTGCYLSASDDRFDGGPGPDIVYGGRSNDILNGGGGDDLLYGGLGDDALSGDDGNDLLSGGHGADGIDGKAGNDYVRGDGTADTLLDSGGGTDTISFATGVTPGFPDNAAYPSFASYTNFPPYGGERGVYIDLSRNVADNGVAIHGGGVDTLAGGDFETVIGTPFSDFIVGSDGNNTIYGGGGGDVILGAGGADSLYGGADGDHLDGGSGANRLFGNAGSDYCRTPATRNSCERSSTGVILRNPARISVGFLAQGAPGRSHLYLAGSNLADSVSASYAPGNPARVTFSRLAGSAGSFDTSSSAAGGCGSISSSRVVCTLPGGLDAIVLAGGAGGDRLQTSGLQPGSSPMLLGAEGGDHLSGGESTEDVLVDGPDSTGVWSDRLDGLGADDLLTNNGGADDLFGGAGNDLFLSTTICGGDELNGGGDRDNASWARYDAPIEARIAEGLAGRPGTGSGPVCGADPFDTLLEIEALEGTRFGDTLFGGPGPDQLLGRAGADTFHGAGGADLLLTHSADADRSIVCGDDLDIAVIDHPQYGDLPDPDCESTPTENPKYAG
jgi:Ca2+-binding RTX toxin-like protein